MFVVRFEGDFDTADATMSAVAQRREPNSKGCNVAFNPTLTYISEGLNSKDPQTPNPKNEVCILPRAPSVETPKPKEQDAESVHSPTTMLHPQSKSSE